MAPDRLVLTVGAILTFGCSSVEPVVAPDELLVGVILDADGHPISAALHPSGAVTAEGGRLILWSLPEEAFRLPEDVSVSDLSARLESEHEPRDSCGRCLAPESGPPWILFHGDACPIPASSRVFSGDAWVENTPEVDRIRLQVRIDVPAPCDFPEVELEPSRDFAFELVYPPRAEEQGVFAGDISGVVVGASQQGLFRSVPGQALERYPVSSLPRVATSLFDGRFVIGRSAPGINGPQWEPLLIDDRLDDLTRLEEMQIRVNRLIATPSKPGMFLALGHGEESRSPMVTSGEWSGDQFVSRDVTPAGALNLGTEVNGAAWVDGSTTLLLSSHFRDGTDWGVQLALVDLESGQSAKAIVDRAIFTRGKGEVDHLTWSANRAYMVFATSNALQVFARDFRGDFLSINENPDEALAEDWTLLEERPTESTGCHCSLETDRGMAIACDDGLALSVTSSSAEWISLEEVWPEGEALSNCQSLGRWDFLQTQGGSILRRRDEDPFEHVLGPPPGLNTTFSAIVPVEDGFLAFGESGLVAHVDARTSSVSKRKVEGLPDRPFAVASDPANPESLWIGGSDAGTETGQLVRWQGGIPERLRTPNAPPIITALLPVGPNEALALGGNGVLRIRGSEVETVTIAWDDPATRDHVEEAPPPCTRRFAEAELTRERLGPLTAMDVVGGVVWAAGCNQAVVRLTKTDTGWTGRRVFTKLIGPAIVWADRGFTGVRALAPDQILLGAEGRSEQNREQGALYELKLFADGPRAELTALEGSVHATPANSVGLGGGGVFAVLGDEKRGLVVISGGRSSLTAKSVASNWIYFNARKGLAAAWHETFDQVLLGGEGSGLILGRR